MDKIKELTEAKEAAEQLVARIDNAIRSLNSASSWGWLDLFGGGFFSSIIKRENIKNTNRDIAKISEALQKLNQELEDVNMHLPSEISDTIVDNFFDVWFDNIFTDMRVQTEIAEQLRELKNFRSDILNLIGELENEIGKN